MIQIEYDWFSDKYGTDLFLLRSVIRHAIVKINLL